MRNSKCDELIWKELVTRGKAIAAKAKDMFIRDQHLPGLVVAWPHKTILDDAGKKINDLVVLELPSNIPIRKALKDMSKRVQPYALLTVEHKEQKLVVVMESIHGTVAWKYPVYRRGDIDWLGDCVESKNTDALGILWRSN
jgi:hypothetical protein